MQLDALLPACEPRAEALDLVVRGALRGCEDRCPGLHACEHPAMSMRKDVAAGLASKSAGQTG